MPSGSRAKPKTAVVEGIVRRLEEVFGETPYTVRFDPTEELVACILSQHTSDANSFPAFYRLRDRFKSWQDLVDAGHEQVAEVIKSAGLANQKSKSIIRCLTEIRNRTGGYSLALLKEMSLIEARSWLTSLPGVGPKTASIVLCFALGLPAIPVDTHVYRVSWRFGLIPEAIGESKAHDLLLDIVPPHLAFRFHMALIHQGRAICKAPLPNCEACTLKTDCLWYKAGGPQKRAAQIKKNRKAVKA
jgi:endonuclease III